jgi:CDP-glucose 4,6-dehydratase
LDCSKAQRNLGWHPRLPLSEALAWTVDWYKAYKEAHKNHTDLRALCEDQINQYQTLVPS